jgi:hypothetical protein
MPSTLKVLQGVEWIEIPEEGERGLLLLLFDLCCSFSGFGPLRQARARIYN